MAVESLTADDADDPEVLSELRPHALRVTLAEGEKKMVDLRLARYRRAAADGRGPDGEP